MTDEPEERRRRSRPTRIGDLLPEAARALGLEDELRLGRAIATWDALIAERVPPAVGACRLIRLEPGTVVVAVAEPIVAAALRMRALGGVGPGGVVPGTAPGGVPVRQLRLVPARDPERREGPDARV